MVDFGTATNFDAVSAAGEYVGGVIAPGIEISMDALFARAARLTKVDLAAPADGDRQDDRGRACRAGAVYGFAGQVDGIVAPHARASSAAEATTVATGGLADLILPHAETLDDYQPDLTLEGLRLVWQRNRG